MVCDGRGLWFVRTIVGLQVSVFWRLVQNCLVSCILLGFLFVPLATLSCACDTAVGCVLPFTELGFVPTASVGDVVSVDLGYKE